MRRDFDEDRLFTLNPTTENCTLQTNITDSIRISTEPPANATDPTFVWRIECGLENASLIIDMMKPTYLTDEMIRLHVLSEDDCNMKFSCEVYGVGHNFHIFDVLKMMLSSFVITVKWLSTPNYTTSIFEQYFTLNCCELPGVDKVSELNVIKKK